MSKGYDVTKTLHTLSRAGKTICTLITDTIFIDGIPHLVFEWEPQSDGSEKPVLLVRLDPQYLHPVVGQGNATHSYEHPVEDPRQFD